MNIRERVRQWPQPWRGMWLERASVIEYDGGQPRRIAEQMAYLAVAKMMRTEAGMVITDFDSIPDTDPETEVGRQ